MFLHKYYMRVHFQGFRVFITDSQQTEESLRMAFLTRPPRENQVDGLPLALHLSNERAVVFLVKKQNVMYLIDNHHNYDFSYTKASFKANEV